MNCSYFAILVAVCVPVYTQSTDTSTKKTDLLQINLINLEKIINGAETPPIKIIEEYIYASAQNEQINDIFEPKKIAYAIRKYLGPVSASYKEYPPLHMIEFEIGPAYALRRCWEDAEGDSTNKLAITPDYGHYTRLVKKNYEADTSITKKNMIEKLAGLYKIQLMPPSAEPTKNLPVKAFWIDTDKEAAAKIVATVLELIKTDPIFRRCIEAFKFISALSIPDRANDIYPLLVLYTRPGKKYAQYVASKLYEKLKISKKNKNHVYLTPRFNQKFGDGPISYILGDGEYRAYKNDPECNYQWVDTVYDGPFFKESFVGVSKKDQMLTLPKE